LGREYNLNLIKRSFTGFLIIVPMVLIILAQNYWIFLVMVSAVCAFAFYEWVKNNFRHPVYGG